MKYILKKAIADILPPTILNRKDKMGFPFHFICGRKTTPKHFSKIS